MVLESDPVRSKRWFPSLLKSDIHLNPWQLSSVLDNDSIYLTKLLWGLSEAGHVQNLTQSKVVRVIAPVWTCPANGREDVSKKHLQNKEMRHLSVLHNDSNSKTGLGRFQGKCSLKSVLSCQICALQWLAAHDLKTGSLGLFPVPPLIRAWPVSEPLIQHFCALISLSVEPGWQ